MEEGSLPLPGSVRGGVGRLPEPPLLLFAQVILGFVSCRVQRTLCPLLLGAVARPLGFFSASVSPLIHLPGGRGCLPIAILVLRGDRAPRSRKYSQATQPQLLISVQWDECSICGFHSRARDRPQGDPCGSRSLRSPSHSSSLNCMLGKVCVGAGGMVL